MRYANKIPTGYSLVDDSQYVPSEGEMLMDSIDSFMMQRREPEFNTVQSAPSTAEVKDLKIKAAYAEKAQRHGAQYSQEVNPRREEQDMLMGVIANMNQPQQPRNNALEQAIYNQQQQDQQRQLENQASQQYFQQQMPMPGYEGGSGQVNASPMETYVPTYEEDGGAPEVRSEDTNPLYVDGREQNRRGEKQVANAAGNPDGKSAFQHLNDVSGDDTRRVSF